MKISRNIAILLVLALFAGAAYGQKKKKNAFELKFILENVQDAEVYIARYYGGQTYIEDTLYPSPKAINTYIWALDSFPARGVYVLAGESKAKYLDFFIDTSHYFTILWNLKEFEQLGATAHTVITGSPENAAAFDYMKKMTLFEKEARELIQKLKDTSENAIKDSLTVSQWNEQLQQCRITAGKYMDSFLTDNADFLFGKIQKLLRDISYPDPPQDLDSTELIKFYINHKLNHYWDNCDFNETALNNTPVFHGVLERYFNENMIPIPDSIIKYADLLIEKAKNNSELFKYIVWFVTNKYESSQYVSHDAVFVHMVKNYYGKGLCPWVNEAVLERMVERADILDPILIGKVPPELVMPDVNNVYHSIFEFDTRYTILWFWNLDCGHCKTSTPKLVELYNRAHKELDFEVYAVCDGVDTTRWKQTIIEKQLPWLNVGRNTANLNYRIAFDIQTTPMLYILDKDKKIICKRINVEDIETVLRGDMEGKRFN
jgi:thiol-disulfide isomerase/thioredoxin